MKAMDWNTFARKWPHLHHLEFPKSGPRFTVDTLIGLDCADLQYSVKRYSWYTGSTTWSTPLRWTCIGVVGNFL